MVLPGSFHDVNQGMLLLLSVENWAHRDIAPAQMNIVHTHEATYLQNIQVRYLQIIMIHFYSMSFFHNITMLRN